MFAFRETRGPVAVAFTDRHGGVSEEPYSSLNLAQSGGDSPVLIEENIRRATAAFTAGGTTNPVRVVRMHQVHGANVEVIGADVSDDVLPESDGLVTAARGVVLMVRVADCVPVLLADVESGVVGAAHAGRPGMVAGVVPATVARMRELGADRITAWVGPHVCGSCYEVPEQMREEVVAVVPEAFATTSWGTPAVDVGAGVRAQLTAAEVEVVDAARCTIEDENLYSYRRQGTAAGRFAGLVWVRP